MLQKDKGVGSADIDWISMVASRLSKAQGRDSGFYLRKHLDSRSLLGTPGRVYGTGPPQPHCPVVCARAYVPGAEPAIAVVTKQKNKTKQQQQNTNNFL